MIENFFRALWILTLLFILANFSIKREIKPTVLLDKSYSSRAIFEDLKAYEDAFLRRGFRVVSFGSDSLSDIGGEIGKADCPCILISDGLNNSPNDPISASIGKPIYILLPKYKEPPVLISEVRLRNPPRIGEFEKIKISLTSELNDSMMLYFNRKKYSSFVKSSATFRLGPFSERDTISIKIRGDSIRFYTYSPKEGKTAFVIYKLSPFVRFLRGKFPDAEILKEEPKGNYNLLILISPRKIDFNKPSVVFVDENTEGFRKRVGEFFLRGDLPPLREIYEPSFKLDKIYERFENLPIIALKGRSLLVLSPDLWKVWLADGEYFKRFSEYLDENFKVFVEVFTEKAVYFLGDVAEVFISGYGFDAFSINGRKFPFEGFHTYRFAVKDTGEISLKFEFFRKGDKISTRTLKIYGLPYVSEKRKLGVDTSLLKNLAQVSGGGILKDTSEAFNLKFYKKIYISDFYPIFLLTFLFMLLDWGIRRYKGKV
jgi:hypothetical protein